MKNKNLIIGAIAIGAIYLLTRKKKSKATKPSKGTSGGGGGGVPTGEGMIVGGSRPTMKQCIANPDLVGCEDVLPELRNELTRDAEVRDVYGDAILDIFLTDTKGVTKDSSGRVIDGGEGGSGDSEPISSPQPSEPVKEEPVVEEPVKEEPVKEEPVKEEPVKEEPVVEEPVKEDPVKEEPVKEEPVKEEPVKSEPVKSEPVKEGSITKSEPTKSFVGTRMDVPTLSEISMKRRKGRNDRLDFDGEYGSFISDGF